MLRKIVYVKLYVSDSCGRNLQKSLSDACKVCKRISPLSAFVTDYHHIFGRLSILEMSTLFEAIMKLRILMLYLAFGLNA